MASNNIIVKFKPTGHAAMKKAIIDLAKAKAILDGQTSKYRQTVKKLNLDQAKLDKHFGFSQKNNRLLANSFATLRSQMLLASFGTMVVAQSVGKFIKVASDAEEIANKFNVVFGENADVVRRWATAFGESIGRSQQQLEQMASTLQDTFVPLGFTRNEATKLSTSLVKLSLDVASFNNSSDDEVLKAFQSALVGNHETVRKYGIVITEASLKEEAYQSGIIKTRRELTNQEKVQARLNILYSGSKDAIGDLERTQDSYANQVKAFQSELVKLQRALGETLIPLATMLVKIGRHFADTKTLKVYASTLGIIATAYVVYNRAAIAATLNTKRLGVAMKSIGKVGKVAIAIFLAEMADLMTTVVSNSEDLEKELEDLEKDIENLDSTIGSSGGLSSMAVEMKRFQEIIQGVQLMTTLEHQLKISKDLVASKKAEAEAAFIAYENAIGTSEEEEKKLAATNAVVAATKVETEEAEKQRIINEAIAEFNKQNEIYMLNLIPNLQLEADLAENKKKFKGAELELQNLITTLQARGIELTKEEVAEIEKLLKLKEKELTTQEKIAMRTNEAIAGMRATTSEWKANMDSRLQKEMDTLRKSSEFERANSKKKEKLEKEINDKFAKEKKRIWIAEQTGKIGQATMNAYEAGSKAWAQGGVFGGVGAVIATLAGLAQVTLIAAQKPPQFATGGLVGGRRHSQGGTIIEAEQGEFVMSRNATDAIGIENLNRMNQGGGGAVNITFTGNVMSQDFIEQEAIPQIKEAIRRGADIGVS